MSSMKRGAVAAVAAVIILGLVGASFAQRTQVVFWQFDTRDAYVEAWQDALAGFHEANPDIEVVMEIVPWAEQMQRLVSALATGGLPDVSFLGNNVVAQFQAIGALAPLDTYFEAYSREHGYDVADDVWPGDRGYYFLDGQWFASPLAVETRALYYRKDLFEQAGLDPDGPPQTWDELVEFAVALTGDGVYGWAAPMGIEYLTIQNFMAVYLSHGARMLDEEGRCGLETPEFYQALSTYVGAYERGATHPDAATMSGDEFRRGFLDGRFAMIIDHPGIWADLQREGAAFAEDVAVTHVPAGPEGRFGFLGGWPLVLWAESTVKDAAAEWILYATRPEGALRELSITSGMIPGSIKLAQQDPWDAYPYSVFVEQLAFAYPYQYPDQAIAEMGQLEVNAFQTAVQAVALGQRTVEQAAADLCRLMDDVLAR